MISKRFVLFGCACLTAVMLWPATASAQFYVGVGVGWGHYYRPYYPYYGYGYYRPFYSPFYSPFYGFYGGWSPFYGGYAYPPYYYGGNWASARIEVKPVQASVYVDGYFVGEVDRFDGVFQRLDLPTGEHEIAVYLPGHRTYRERTLFRPGASYHFRAALEPLPAGTPDEPAPKPDPRVRGRDQSGDPGDPQDPRYRGEPREPRDPRDPYGPPPQDPRRTQPPPDRPGDRRGDRAPESGDFGTLTVRVQPADAVVIIDGERWDSPEGGSRLIVQLVGGQHRIEVRKEGFKPYTSTVQIRPGETQSLNISLPPGGPQNP